jgi:hypothetical protein
VHLEKCPLELAGYVSELSIAQLYGGQQLDWPYNITVIRER